MPLTPDDKQWVQDFIAEKLDLVSAFRGLDVADREKIAADLEKYLYSRQEALRKPVNTYTPRITVSGADLNLDDLGVSKGHLGPTLPQTIDFIGSGGYLDRTDPSIAHIRVTGGAGSDCLFNYLVSTCFATLTGFTEGMVFTTLSGCTFRGYSTVQGAVTRGVTDFPVLAGIVPTIAICGGTYAEDVVLTSGLTPNMFGTGNSATVIQSMYLDSSDVNNTSSFSMIRDIRFSGGGTKTFDVVTNTARVRFENCNFGTVSGSSTPVIRFASTHEFYFHACRFISGTMSFSSHQDDISFNQCEFDIDLTMGGTDGIVGIADSHFNNCRLLMAGGYDSFRIVDNIFDHTTVVSAIAFSTAVSKGKGIIDGNTFDGIYTTAVIDITNWPSGTTNSGITIVGNTFKQLSGAGTIPPYLTASDADTSYITFVGNTFLPNAAGNFAAFAVTGTIANSCFGPNAPVAVLYNVTGTGNYFIPASGGVGGASAAEAFVTIGNTAGLSAERALALTPADGEHTFTDGGANSSVTLVGVDTASGQKGHVAFDATVPAAIGTAAAGAAATAGRRDHVHPTGAGTPTTIAAGDAAAIGTGPAASMTDHRHGAPSTFAATPHNLLDGSVDQDTLAGSVVDGDTIIGNVTPKWSRLAISVPAANVRNVMGVDNGELRPSWKAILDGTNPAAIGTVAPGTALTAAHRDHIHATGAGTPSTQAFGDAASTGTGPAAAMTDHKHAMPANPVSANGAIRTISFIVDGGGSTITTGIKGDLEVPFACTINRVTMLADQSGSIVVDIWKDTYANYPPTVADTITAAAKPTITTATKSQDATLTGWTTSIAAGDTLRYNVDSITTCTRVLVSLKVTES